MGLRNIAFALAWLWSGSVWAQDLLVLSLAQDTAGRVLEEQYVEELALTLDAGTAQLWDLGDPAFQGLALGDQVESVRLLLAQEGAVAVGWLDGRPVDRIDLTLVFVSEDRAVARLLQAQRDGEPVPELALATREVLAALAPVAIAPAPEPLPAPPVVAVPPQTPSGVLVGLVFEADAPGAPGASGRLGLGVRWHRALRDQTLIEVGGSLQLGPPRTVGGRQVQVVSGAPSLGLQHWFGLWGPRLTLDVPVHRVTVDGEQSWGGAVRLAPGLGVQAKTFRVELSLALAPVRHQVRDRTTHELVWDSGWADLVLALAWSGTS
jgi:hypothetical protein